MRDYDGRITFNPKLPEGIEELCFPLQIRGQKLKVKITNNEVEYLLEKGIQLEISHKNKTLQLKEGVPVACKI